MPLLPVPLDTASASSSTSQQAATRATAAGPAADVPAASQTSTTTHWQLSSPESHRHRSDGHVAQRGAVFEYASEAVTTLEQQYGDALQRLNTMHRLYDRLDAHNRTLASELKRVRQVSDALHNGVAFHLYSSVRQVKHEMKLLKQYVELLSSNFSNQLHVLQQVVGEELPHSAEGRLQPMETRVSIGAASGGARSLERVTKAPSPVLGRHVTRAGGGVGAGTQFYSQDYWWNVMSPHPIRPPSSAHTQTAPADMDAGGWADVVNGCDRGTTEGERDLSPPGQLPLSIEDSRENNLLIQSSGEALVSRRAYREVQEALADAQRRVVELEQTSSNQQADYENRIAQLKAAHRAKEATLKEELALQRRRAELAQDGEPQKTALSTGLPGQAAGLVSPADVNQLVQLLLEHQYQQPTAKQRPGAPSKTSSPASTVQPPRQARHKAVRSPLRKWEEADETTGQKDSLHGSEDTSATTNDSDRDCRRRAAHPCATESAPASNTDDGNGDLRPSFVRPKRRVLRAIASNGSGRNRTGADGDLHMPDRYSPAAAARRVERAGEMLGCEARDGESQQQGQRAHSSSSSGNRRQREKVVATEAAGATASVRRSLAYERLMDHSRAASTSAEGYASHSGRSAARTRPRTVSDADAPSVPKRRSSRRGQSAGGAARDPRHGGGAGPELLRSLLSRVEAVGVQGGSRCAVPAPKRVRPVQSQPDTKVDRVAQGIWAQELLKERRCL
ncbi:conserved hypothetical protein [Leishmania major strain Friedlin]|uniref:Uncharacterized protein n=1 Tax=Leishmania major TaxID=5664 RepID=Q4Q9Y9_LEIMA|nr:conserved hypothetical protein [Leishmania major strain Friedlin]CAG9575119.1 hypothetical_protein_-_conserved [Leishmania major strain Friedlin]CAJ05120.1 conserved hypothetical protein [Leishmania major strain Friedlin]|eukprot:XP_001683859.1 conserved hypothetical protein [Leishmania major strain Friedlin]